MPNLEIAIVPPAWRESLVLLIGLIVSIITMIIITIILVRRELKNEKTK